MMTALVLVLLICFSAFFSSVEMALNSLNKIRLEKLAERGSKTAKMTKKLEDRYKDTLSSILIGNNLVNTAASSIATGIALRFFPDNEALGGTVATVVVTVVLLIFGEIVPKMVGKAISLPLARTFSYPLRFFMILFRPVTIVVVGIVSLLSRLWNRNGKSSSTVTEEELSTIIDTVEEEGVIDEDKGELLQSALDFSDRTVEDILTPRVDLESIDVDDSNKEILDTVLNAKHSRLPVYRDTVDHIIGILRLSSFLKEVGEKGADAVRVEDHLTEAIFVHKTTKLPDALDKMKEKQIHLLVVLDEYGGTLGIVTMEDILEDIVGDIWDEGDVIEEEIRKVGDNTYEVLGQTNIEDFFAEIDFDDRDFESEYTTVGGFAVEMLNEEVHEGDSFTYKNLYFIVTSMADNIVEKLTVVVRDENEAEDEKDA